MGQVQHEHRGRVQEIELSAGPIEYEDTGGTGPVVVFLHGLLMDSSLWTATIAALGDGYRCITPTFPLGAHRRPLRDGADVSMPALARLVEEFLDRLELDDVTLAGVDTGGALVQLVMTGAAPRVRRVVLASCDAFDNFPPGLTGRTLFLLGRLSPALFGLFLQQMRLKVFRRLPLSFGHLTRRGDATVSRWLHPLLTQPAIRRDTVRVLRAASADRTVLVDAATHFPSFTRPALVVWAAEDRVMPPPHGHRLAALLPDSRLSEVDDSYTLLPLDRPAELARLIDEFLRTT